MRELGYLEGRNVLFEVRAAEGRSDRLPTLAGELVQLKVDVFVTAGTDAALAAKKLTSTIPVVMATGNDPVSSGIVGGLARPGGNITGLTTMSSELSGKRLELARELVQPAARLGLLWSQSSELDRITVRETEAAARALGLELRLFGVSTARDLEKAFAAVAREHVAALLVSTYPWFFTERRLLMELASRYRMPTVFAFRQYADAGGLASYGPDLSEMFRRAAVYTDRILKGARPGDLPVERPTKFELVVNLKTARALGLTIPQSVLMRADEVIR
jgi:putative ABC transport system substrate-binding protein